MSLFKLLAFVCLLGCLGIGFAQDATSMTFQQRKEAVEVLLKKLDQTPLKVTYEVDSFSHYQADDPRIVVLSTDGTLVEFQINQGHPDAMIDGKEFYATHKGVSFQEKKLDKKMIRVTSKKVQEAYYLGEDHLYRDFSIHDGVVSEGAYQQLAVKDGETFLKHYTNNGDSMGDLCTGKEAKEKYVGPEFQPGKYLKSLFDACSWMADNSEAVDLSAGKKVTMLNEDGGPKATVALTDDGFLRLCSENINAVRKKDVPLYYTGETLFLDQVFPLEIMVGSSDVDGMSCWSRIRKIQIEEISRNEFAFEMEKVVVEE